MPEIKPPVDVDSLGKLNEWLETCGMPQRNAKLAFGRQLSESDPSDSIEFEAWGFGFSFDRENREEANAGYRRLISHVAGALYGRFSDPRYASVVWRIRPELDENAIVKSLDPEGNEVDPITYRGDLTELRLVDTGRSSVQFYCRLAFLTDHL